MFQYICKTDVIIPSIPEKDNSKWKRWVLLLLLLLLLGGISGALAGVYLKTPRKNHFGLLNIQLFTFI